MANWIFNAKQDLKEYASLKECLENIPEQVSEMESRIISLKAVQYDKTPVQGGMSGHESRLIDFIDKKERLLLNYEIAKAKVARIERGLSVLNDRERFVIEKDFFEGWRIESICVALNYEERTIYNIKNTALKKFTLAMFGVLDI